MRRLFFILTLLFAILAKASAQDVIILSNGDEVNGKVEEITTSEIKYRKSAEGPLFVLPATQVFMIRYANGEKDVFGLNNGENASGNQAASADYPYYPKVSRAYNVGDYFNEDGVEGIVFHVTDGGRHGLIMNIRRNWDYYNKNVPIVKRKKLIGFSRNKLLVGANSENDGWYNHQQVLKFAQENGISLETDFIHYGIAGSFVGNGWYLPSTNEAVLMVKAFQGGDLSNPSKAARNAMKKTFKQHGGSLSLFYMWDILTSTEADNQAVFLINCQTAMKRTIKKDSGDYGLDYCVHKF